MQSYLAKITVFNLLWWLVCLFVHGAVPSVVETAAVLGVMSWVQVDEHGLGPLQDPETELLDYGRGDQHEVQYCCVHVHLCSEASFKKKKKN